MNVSYSGTQANNTHHYKRMSVGDADVLSSAESFNVKRRRLLDTIH